MSGAPSWPPSFFDLLDPDGPGVSSSVIVSILIDDLASNPKDSPDWRIDQPGGTAIRLSPISEAQIGFAAGGVEGVIALVHDPSGWLRVDLTVGGAEVFRAFVDRPYQEYEFWPPGAVKSPEGKSPEAPGRMGKRHNWISLDVEAWPVLKSLANVDRFLNLMAVE